MELAVGQIIYLNENESSEVDQPFEISSDVVKKTKKPIKTRSPVYKFFEWNEEISKWTCTTCK